MKKEKVPIRLKLVWVRHITEQLFTFWCPTSFAEHRTLEADDEKANVFVYSRINVQLLCKVGLDMIKHFFGNANGIVQCLAKQRRGTTEHASQSRVSRSLESININFSAKKHLLMLSLSFFVVDRVIACSATLICML